MQRPPWRIPNSCVDEDLVADQTVLQHNSAEVHVHLQAESLDQPCNAEAVMVTNINFHS